MSKFLNEFKEFAMRGNVLDMEMCIRDSLNSINGRVHLSTATVEISSMNVDAQWFATHALGMNSGWECKPCLLYTSRCV